MQTRLHVYIGILLWLACTCAPFFLVSTYSETYLIVSNMLQSKEFVLLTAGIPVLLIFDLGVLTLLSTVCRVFARALNKGWYPLGCLIYVSGFLLVVTYCFLYLASWYLFSVRGIFPSIPEILSTIFTTDVNAMRFLLHQSHDWKTLLYALCFVIVPAFAIWILSAPAFSRTLLRSRLIELLTLFVLGIAPGVYLRLILPQEGRVSLAAQAHASLSPAHAIWWTDLMLGAPTIETSEIAHVTNPKMSLEQWAAKDQGAPVKSNLVLLFVEAFRADVLFKIEQGKEITPFLNSVARRGFYFEHAYSNAPETSYGQSTLLTGLHPLKYLSKDLNAQIDYPVSTIFDLAKQFNYRTSYLTEEWLITRRLTNSPRIDLRFDPKYDTAANLKGLLTEEEQRQVAIFPRPSYILDVYNRKIFFNWLEQNLSAPFLHAQYISSTHFPYQWFPEMGSPLFHPEEPNEEPSFFGYSAETKGYLWLNYLNLAHWVDQYIESYFKKLEALGLLDSTAIVITGDHGELFLEHGQVTHGGYLYEPAVRVPLVIKPAVNTQLRPCQERQAVSHLDICPTMLDLMGLPSYPGFQGSSMLARCSAENESCLTSPVYMTNQVTLFEDAIIDWPWKLVVGYRTGRMRLYNLSVDPGEAIDLAHSETTRLDELKKKLDQFRQTQFSYYLGDAQFRAENFPPRLPRGN